MSGVVSIMRNMGFSSEDYPYWVREDGCKMLGPYIMCAANLDRFPRGTTVESSLGTCLVCDTGGFAASNPTQLDIATNWQLIYITDGRLSICYMFFGVQTVLVIERGVFYEYL